MFPTLIHLNTIDLVATFLPQPKNFSHCVSHPLLLIGDEVVDLAKSDEEDPSDNSKLKKKVGLPEWDPDALPSSQLNKYLNLANT